MIQKIYINDRYIRLIPSPTHEDKIMVIEYADKGISEKMETRLIAGQSDYVLPAEFDASRIIDVTVKE